VIGVFTRARLPGDATARAHAHILPAFLLYNCRFVRPPCRHHPSRVPRAARAAFTHFYCLSARTLQHRGSPPAPAAPRDWTAACCAYVLARLLRLRTADVLRSTRFLCCTPHRLHRCLHCTRLLKTCRYAVPCSCAAVSTARCSTCCTPLRALPSTAAPHHRACNHLPGTCRRLPPTYRSTRRLPLLCTAMNRCVNRVAAYRAPLFHTPTGLDNNEQA